MISTSRFVWQMLAVVTMLFGALPQISAAAQADATPSGFSADGSISVQVFTCPETMTRDTLVVKDCTVKTDGFAIELHQNTVDGPLTLADSTFNGVYVWSGLPVAPTID